MHVDWQTLGEIAVMAAAAALALVLLVALALVASADRRGAAAGTTGATRPRTYRGQAVAVLCLLAAGLIAGYGLYLIVA